MINKRRLDRIDDILDPKHPPETLHGFMVGRPAEDIEAEWSSYLSEMVEETVSRCDEVRSLYEQNKASLVELSADDLLSLALSYWKHPRGDDIEPPAEVIDAFTHALEGLDQTYIEAERFYYQSLMQACIEQLEGNTPA